MRSSIMRRNRRLISNPSRVSGAASSKVIANSPGWIRLRIQSNQLKVSQPSPIVAMRHASHQITMSRNLSNQTALKHDMAGELLRPCPVRFSEIVDLSTCTLRCPRDRENHLSAAVKMNVAPGAEQHA